MIDELDPPFELLTPAIARGPVLFNLPHSGRVYPRRFQAQTRLDLMTLRRSEDAFVDDLFAGVVLRGAPLLKARFPRAYVDVNREPYELDPAMFSGPLPKEANIASVRVAGGLGTIARIVTERDEIYQGPIPVEDAIERIETLYKPYHRALADTLEGLARRFGAAILIDCHSMPSMRQDAARRPDFILGDRYNTSCSRLIVDVAHNRLRRLGYTVTRNKPYAGGYITETYGQPHRGFHALQIEINRGLYMDERRVAKLPSFANLQTDLMVLVEDLIALSPAGLMPSQAAE
ncbi:MAG: N-formylglutamate amidohydrolase [Rhodobiaceae bacterium]|nr:N-formylglutamate amidohydrolase [Rhodobiaceae bacterium]